MAIEKGLPLWLIRRCEATLTSRNERPLTVRRRKTDLLARVNGNLPLEFADITLTSYAGLELFARYLRRVDFNRQVRDAFDGMPRWGAPVSSWKLVSKLWASTTSCCQALLAA